MKIKAESASAYVLHCENLCKLAGIEPNFWEGHKLYQKLRRLELKASRLNERECNGDITSDGAFDLAKPIIAGVFKLLPRLDSASFYLNGDPRGYALKIRDQFYDGQETRSSSLGNPGPVDYGLQETIGFMRENNFHKDMGGYGILAPEF